LLYTGAISPGGPSITVCLLVVIADPSSTNKTKDILAAALDSGLAISILVIFFALQFPKNGTVSVASLIHRAFEFHPVIQIGANNVLVWWG
jgi:hypothetical protein